MLEVGDRLRHYEIKGEIARTKMSTVYHAVDESLGREVALKELGRYLTADQAFVDRFEREARITASLNHRNIVAIWAYFVDEDRGEPIPYIVMEYCRLGDLGRVKAGFTLPQIMTVMADVLAALTAAGEQGVVHRDLKPENLLRTHQGSVRVADFGIAKVYGASGSSAFTEPGKFQGSLFHVAPEVVLGKEADPRSDLYSLGVIAYHLLTGRLPFDDEPTDTAVLVAKTQRDPASIAKAHRDVPIGLALWVDRLLQRRPERRFSTADEASVALEVARTAAGVIREPLPTTPDPEPEPDVSPPMPRTGFATWDELRQIAPGSSLLLHAATNRPTLLVVGALVVTAYFLEPWLAAVALVAWMALGALTLFDRGEAQKARERARPRSRASRHPRSR